MLSRIAHFCCVVLMVATQMSLGYAAEPKQAGKRTDTKKASPNPVKELQIIVDRFESFFKSRQKLLTKFKFDLNQNTKPLFYVIEYAGRDISYDVQKTDSLVSPYVGYVKVILVSRNNGSCGDVSSGYRNQLPVGWTSSPEAIQAQDRNECYTYPAIEPFSDVVHFQFAYQDDRWIFKRALRVKYGSDEQPISAVFGIEISKTMIANEADALAFNQGWLRLVTPQ